MTSPALFLDRDGVIIANRPEYVRFVEDIRYLPGSLQSIARASSTRLRIAIISNQSAVGRGIITKQRAEDIQQSVVDAIESAGGRVDGSFLCFHQPADNCDCRKPKPGLLHQAAEALGIDLPRSILIGDAASDMRAGINANIGSLAMLRTGLGKAQQASLSPAERSQIQVFDNLEDAIAGLIPSTNDRSTIPLE
ncbi:MAG: HAD-IIIA family hydrolase [Anaerolineales bacterium]